LRLARASARGADGEFDFVDAIAKEVPIRVLARIMACRRPAWIGSSTSATGCLLSTLLRAEVDGERLSEVDLDNFFSILVIAGNETTRIAIAQGILAFCEHPEQWDRLRADPVLLDKATDEVLRWTCPPHFMRRTATRDTELAGAQIGAGDKVVLWYVTDHVLFGTDIPLGGPTVVADTIADIEALGLPEADVAAIFAGNARRVLRISA
jgi:cytochrome P450